MNERITENYVRNFFNQYAIKLEEQKSENILIQSALKGAAKTGGGGVARPEFIMKLTPTLVCVVECKADRKKHQSEAGDKYAEYAVDGVKCYAAFLSREFDVVAVAVSGESELLISTFLHKKGEDTCTDLGISNLLPPEDYVKLAKADKEVDARAYDKLLSSAEELHEFLTNKAKLRNEDKPAVVAGILIALTDEGFEASYDKSRNDKELAAALYTTISTRLTAANLNTTKLNNILTQFEFIKHHTVLALTNRDSRPLLECIKHIDSKVKPFINHYHEVDVVGQFYGAFVSSAAGDGRGLGIVLTPKHICSLFVKLANVGKDTILLDPCCGTGGFLLAGMSEMIKAANGDSAKIANIRKDQLVGVELQPSMYALAVANMFLRGDGKSNIYLGSALDNTICKSVTAHNPTACCINPPYAQEEPELRFIIRALDCLTPNSTLVAVIPVDRISKPDPLKTELMSKHSLEAVMALPEGVFAGVGTITCAMVCTAKVPHSKYKPTWFARWKDDGFAVVQNRGRLDQGNWDALEEKWVRDFNSKVVTPDYSTSQVVTADDEWNVDAWVETDYSKIDLDAWFKLVDAQNFEKAWVDRENSKLADTI